ncbi:CAP domain-containing protein [Candidatus Daviesbacteria bacterium]|nr:CAP domain-containing protein [Candidatus Daviesbacteria bacterium]
MQLLAVLVAAVTFSAVVGLKITSMAYEEETLLITPSPISTLRRPSETPVPIVTEEIGALLQFSPTPKPKVSINIVDYLMGQINEYRLSKGLTEVQKDAYTCDFASLRAKEISQNFNHDGFRNRIDSQTLPYPSYTQVTENIAKNSDYQDVVPKWISSPGHAANLEKDTPYVCVGVFDHYYAYLGWKP